DSRNVISANGVAGIYIFSDGSSLNVISGNIIGTDVNRNPRYSTRGQKPIRSLKTDDFLPGFTVIPGAPLNGILILGASQNTVGARRVKGKQVGLSNRIQGNLDTGVYITSRDINGNTYPVPVNNQITGNDILRNGTYGILLYDAPNNPIRSITSENRQLIANKFVGNRTPFRNYESSVDSGARLSTNPLK